MRRFDKLFVQDSSVENNSNGAFLFSDKENSKDTLPTSSEVPFQHTGGIKPLEELGVCFPVPKEEGSQYDLRRFLRVTLMGI